ncbi:DUF1611 domain-containing protein [Thermocoleostomius sinensis]|uniref:DUF1611 domain-containing protein n=1 Tax=Thermocoleostomius sinensis A174 TaxID=2016057 RepID=A0A9E9C910_9CYAN|nr:DUF1611 domain-containing protein [Thermocoleostomius sinensis]WAL60873.1 DUF1611 domain-containing protein [Thermocoleostomius sinensis A174]
MLTPDHRIAILLHEGTQSSRGKTGLSLLRYSEIPIVAVIDYECAGQSLPELTNIPRDVPIVASVEASLAYQPTVLALGIAPSGGALPEAWQAEIKQAVAAGLSIVNGLHTPMSTDPALKALLQPKQWIWDVRQEPQGLTIGSGQARRLPCLRVLMVGTDMSVGKMSTGLELHKTSMQRGLRSRFVATGQTGLMLGHDGVPLDAVRIDFASGAIEQLMMRYGYDYDVLYVEGQGSLMNPASTATLPLLRGSQPTHLVLVHRAGQTHIHNFPDVPIPPLRKTIEVYETVASAGGSFASTKIVAVALNTFQLDEEQAQQAIEQAQLETGLPCTDPIRYGADPILDAILQ